MMYHSLNGYGWCFDVAIALLAALSAGLWLASARVNLSHFGFDMDDVLNRQMKLASKLNGSAAASAAVAAAVQAAKTFFVP